MTKAERIGFIGVGLMGHGMAKNIVEKGYALTVLGHRNRAPVEDLLKRGAREATSPRELAAASDIVFICVTGSREVEAVVRGGLKDGLKSGSVVVDCSLDPGGETILGPQGKKLPFSFQGAGLLLWQDEGNFVRVERCKGTGGGAGGLIHRALVEVYKNGKELGVYYSDPIPDIPTALAVVRKGASVQFLYSRAPKELVVFQEVAMDLQDDVFIGVAASNLSKRPLHARFREFTLMDLEKKPIDVAKVERDKLVVPKYQTLADGTLVYEGAGMKVLTEQGKSAIPEEGMDAKYQGEWSGGRQLLWRATKKGDGLALEFSVPEGKTFDVQLMLTKGPDYGKAIVLFDGKPANASKPFNMYAEKVQLGKPVSLGVLALNKGTHKLQFRVDGKDDKSTGFTIGVDDLRLVPAKTPAKAAAAGGNLQGAELYGQQAVELYREQELAVDESFGHLLLGEVSHRMGNAGEAQAQRSKAHAVYESMAVAGAEARGLAGLASFKLNRLHDPVAAQSGSEQQLAAIFEYCGTKP